MQKYLHCTVSLVRTFSDSLTQLSVCQACTLLLVKQRDRICSQNISLNQMESHVLAINSYSKKLTKAGLM